LTEITQHKLALLNFIGVSTKIITDGLLAWLVRNCWKNEAACIKHDFYYECASKDKNGQFGNPAEILVKDSILNFQGLHHFAFKIYRRAVQ
jgi:hypothetical protein